MQSRTLLHPPTSEGLEWLKVSAAILVPSAAISRYALQGQAGPAIGRSVIKKRKKNRDNIPPAESRQGSGEGRATSETAAVGGMRKRK